MSVMGHVYTAKFGGTVPSELFTYSGYNSLGQGDIAPNVTFDWRTKNYIVKSADSKLYCYNEENTVRISFESGTTFTWDPNIISVSKLGNNIATSISVKTETGNTLSDGKVVFSDSSSAEVTYTYTDTYNFGYNNNGEIVKHSKEYSQTVYLVAAKQQASAKSTEFKFGETAAKIVTIGDDTYVMPDISVFSGSYSITTVGGETVYCYKEPKHDYYKSGDLYAYVTLFNSLSITEYDSNNSALTYNSNTKSKPAGLEFVEWTKAAYGNSGRTDPGFKTLNNKLVYEYGSISSGTSRDDGKFWLAKFKYTDGKNNVYYFYLGAEHNSYTASGGGCFTSDTLITMADGTQKPIEDVTYEDKLLVWDFFTGEYTEKDISILVYHGDENYQVVNSEYSDGTVLRTIAEHGVFDYDLNKYVYLTPENCTEYIGHRFVKYNVNGGYDLVTMTNAFVTEEHTGAYSITSSGVSNAFAENLLTVAPPDDFYNWIEMDGKLHYNVEKFYSDIEKYGTYDYDVFKDYVTYEQYVAFNGTYLKSAVEQGKFSFDYIIQLIDEYSQYMPE